MQCGAVQLSLRGHRKRVEGLLQAGDDNRHVAECLHNDKSSRAHTVFKMQVDVSPAGEGSSVSSELNIVDLAGSERQNAHVRAPGTSSVRREEGGHSMPRRARTPDWQTPVCYSHV